MDLTAARDYILGRLEKELHPDLFYHSTDHALEVHNAVKKIASLEGVDSETVILLETAALYHDSGMMIRYEDHEEMSMEVARGMLPRFGYSEEQVEIVARLIEVTKMTVAPATHEERIICDADFDSLGRVDFLVQSFRLRTEWKIFGIKDSSLDEWLNGQVCFLENHQYYTASARKLRQEQKEKNLKEIKDLLKKHRNI